MSNGRIPFRGHHVHAAWHPWQSQPRMLTACAMHAPCMRTAPQSHAVPYAWHLHMQKECGICLEQVLAKEDPAARRFGLLACDHCFCLGCIRSWRGSAQADESATRACPTCRTLTFFITPSSVWPQSTVRLPRCPAAAEALVLGMPRSVIFPQHCHAGRMLPLKSPRACCCALPRRRKDPGQWSVAAAPCEPPAARDVRCRPRRAVSTFLASWLLDLAHSRPDHRT